MSAFTKKGGGNGGKTSGVGEDVENPPPLPAVKAAGVSALDNVQRKESGDADENEWKEQAGV